MAATDDNETAETLPRHEVDLNGEFRLKVDGKGRVTLPAKFRKVLSKDLVVTLEPTNECVYVFEAPDFNQWVEKLMRSKFPELKENNREQEWLHRALKSRARDVEVDSAGRIMLSADTRSGCAIDKEVVLVGNGERFEIWDAERYEARIAEVDLSLLFT
ncbi:division/cell wall cluster transcriptional repressor MraZ [Adlercreutzia sp. R21]|uniref:Transcriptional regulator MraZ n=1 Tax=Adlercreutzia wanghongyangiae TaxID=3111451 RepID=A0ABU6IJ94_9ACTN|nr:division/cell wall cluster transcriptional repressor MraZ [Adlercreutzia sp. R21]MEC4176413.1 division/cell wall cluster transcriptional repressor MraZ [Adlercreutzia sp. R7]MEC4184613.1 division/cell wall cluster transcriptional repressor MraZ [Adlercreutzia sp. R21]